MDILWSPNHEDKYVTFGSDLSLYKIDSLGEDGSIPKGEGICRTSDHTYSTLLAANCDNQYMKCVAWYPQPQPDQLVAVGLATGKVVLTSLAKVTNDPNKLVGKEFIPKYSRQCIYLAWSPNDSNLLAAGLDKYRQDSSVMIWDVHARPYSMDMMVGSDRHRRYNAAHSHTNDTTIMKPYAEIGHSETTQSLAWFTRENNTLVTGINSRFLRIYDLRDCAHPQSVAYTKSVHGVKVDPHVSYRLASFTEGQVTIWDTRHFEKPVSTIQETRTIIKLAWSPVRHGLLACLPKDSSQVKLYDIQNTSDGSDDLEPAIIERNLQPSGSDPLSSFDWHPVHENRLLTVTPAGNVRDVKIFERIAVAWSPDIYMSWACGKSLVQCHTIKLAREASEDISVQMKRRALRGYGIQKDVSKNADLTDDMALRDLWNWLHHVKQLSASEVRVAVPVRPGNKPPRMAARIPGVAQVIAGEPSNQASPAHGNRSDVDYLNWQGIEGHKIRSNQKRIFRSEQRLRALQLCGWGFDKDSQSSDFIDRLYENQAFERCAAVSVFTLKMKRAIQVLNNGAKHMKRSGAMNLTVVAMALSGFSDDKNTLWKEMCGGLGGQLEHPYLRAMFAFLTADSDNYDAVLKEDGVAVIDRVAFACMYLPDHKLSEYLVELSKQLTETGRLDGILLTGVTAAGLDLLEQYVARTADVQTASCIAIHALPNMEISRDQRVDTWRDSYRGLLDTWRLWLRRAQFDIFMTATDSSSKPQPQVFASCSFCGKSVGNSASLKPWNYMGYGGMYSRSTSQYSAKSTMCPGCRKPLPRCALCLINMGTPSGQGKKLNAAPGQQKDKSAVEVNDWTHRLSPLSDWFTWCQTCRHGGHAEHMTQWFKSHAECPVTGCTCKCNSLDTVTSVSEEAGRSKSLVPVNT